MLVNCLTATLVNRLTAKLVVVNLVKLHLTKLYLERLIHEGAYFQNFTLCHVICYDKEHAVCWAKNSLNKVTCIIIYANLWK